ncbi:hypothetical protein MKZ38_006171 [Zalerion maritima]|uniref:Uncharacterized protein n=1 Tax=Zalerion maritima TaxID=339359 RepID=A0AAD5RJ71_9PEZI|nr:hypothetical protein MKZ38_006171 [Zalerion maritima]
MLLPDPPAKHRRFPDNNNCHDSPAPREVHHVGPTDESRARADIDALVTTVASTSSIISAATDASRSCRNAGGENVAGTPKAIMTPSSQTSWATAIPPTPTQPMSLASSLTDPHHLELRQETTSILTQTVTSNGAVYVTHVTLGGDYHPPSVATPLPHRDLTNAQIGGIVGGVAGFVIIVAIASCVCLKARAVRRDHYARRGWTYDSDDESISGSSGYFSPAGYGAGGGPIRPQGGPVPGPPPPPLPTGGVPVPGPPPPPPQQGQPPGPPPPPALMVNTANYSNPYAPGRPGQQQPWRVDPRYRATR